MKERLEGKQSVLAALKARRRKIEVILISWNAHPENTEAVIKSAEEQGIPVKKVSAEEITSAAKGKTHGGVIAICTPKPLSTNEELFLLSKQRTITPFFVLLEGIEDEQNLGFIIRSAGVMGVNAILLKKHIWAFDPLTLSRVSAGVYEQMPMVKIEKASDILPQLQKMGLKIYGAIAGAKKTMYDVDFTKPTIIALGGEKRGLSGAVRGACDGFFSIPMPARTTQSGGPARTIDTGVSSLSLSHSAAIIMAEVMRQRFLLTK
jgi:23S rRNA (guanosine2251-2'-O)-methyltransferase